MDQDMQKKIEAMRHQRWLVLGDVGLDEYTHGEVHRISPEAPVPVVSAKTQEVRLGLAANVAHNIKRLGGECLLMGRVGCDKEANRLREMLQEVEVSEKMVSEPDRRTTRKWRVLAGPHHLVRVDFEECVPFSSAGREQILATFREHIDHMDGVILQDYGKGVFLCEKLVQEVVAIAQHAGKKILLDPCRTTHLDWFKGVDLMTPNWEEACTLCAQEGSVEEVGHVLLAKMQASQLVITCGSDGMYLFEKGKCTQVPTFAKEVFDVTGAGDTVVAALGLAWNGGTSLQEACWIANHAAGLVVAQSGCVPCHWGDLHSAILKA